MYMLSVSLRHMCAYIVRNKHLYSAHVWNDWTSYQFPHVSVYATTAGSPYIYRNYMVCTVGMGGNDMPVDRARVLNQCQVCAYCINFSIHPRRLFLSSKCSSMVVLNDGTGFKAIKSQNGEKKASVSCHLPRNSSDIGTVLIGTF